MFECIDAFADLNVVDIPRTLGNAKVVIASFLLGCLKVDDEIVQGFLIFWPSIPFPNICLLYTSDAADE